MTDNLPPQDDREARGRLEVSADDPLAKALRPSQETIDRITQMERQNAIGAASLKDFLLD